MSKSLVSEIVVERDKELIRFCLYCGWPCYGLTCGNHRDLLALDPQYQLRRGVRA